MIHWSNYQNEEQYVINALSKPVDQGGEYGVVDPAAFAAQLINNHWSADPPAAYVTRFDLRYFDVLKGEPLCVSDKVEQAAKQIIDESLNP